MVCVSGVCVSFSAFIARSACTRCWRPTGRRAVSGFRNDVVHLRHGHDAIAVTAPTLVLHGDADRVVPLSHAQFNAEAIPGAVLELYEQAGHVFLLTRRAEATARVARHCLAATRSGP